MVVFTIMQGMLLEVDLCGLQQQVSMVFGGVLACGFDFPNDSWSPMGDIMGQGDVSAPIFLPWHIQQLTISWRWPDAMFPLGFPLHHQPLCCCSCLPLPEEVVVVVSAGCLPVALLLPEDAGRVNGAAIQDGPRHPGWKEEVRGSFMLWEHL